MASTASTTSSRVNKGRQTAATGPYPRSLGSSSGSMSAGSVSHLTTDSVDVAEVRAQLEEQAMQSEDWGARGGAEGGDRDADAEAEAEAAANNPRLHWEQRQYFGGEDADETGGGDCWLCNRNALQYGEEMDKRYTELRALASLNVSLAKRALEMHAWYHQHLRDWAVSIGLDDPPPDLPLEAFMRHVEHYDRDAAIERDWQSVYNVVSESELFEYNTMTERWRTSEAGFKKWMQLLRLRSERARIAAGPR